ncbi:hypothetical protein SLEP1_g52447 [Rubroshorea leprosula]|uniref:Uncharacterized protein n=1 Tax=Rubroshorea leprosula TaxID=152421 RepID=A0AAV5M6F4_9ROSI|nr:hypothetical protein SLEP1_g52447 [Rubroshorea leprosula]
MRRHGSACVVVLGDIGRSPRMQYHALSLAHQASLEVDIVAYEEAMSETPSKLAKDTLSLDTSAEANLSVCYAPLVSLH